MKILSVCISLPNESAAWWRIFNIAKLLQNNGHEVEFVFYVSKNTFSKIDSNKINIPFKYSIIQVNFLNIHFKHLMFILKKRYDLVYSNLQSAAFCSILTKLTKIPLVLDMHGDVGNLEEFLEYDLNTKEKSIANLLRYIVNRIIDFSSIKFSDKIICVSKKMISYLEEKGISNDKLVYLTNGISQDNAKKTNRTYLRKKLGINKKMVFGYIGNFQKWQGIEKLLIASESVEDDQITFIIVGGEKKEFRKNIYFFPKIERSEIYNYYSICDVLVLPRPHSIATEIAAPTKFAEYCSMKKPILTSNVGDAADLVKEYNCGIVVENNNPKMLLEGILKFKDINNNDLKIMIKGSEELSKNEFDWNNIKDDFLEVINSLKNKT